MTEMSEHRAPLKPGEIRRHTVGRRTFQVMHVAGGTFTQASVHAKGEPTHVLCTDIDARKAVTAYADAIQAAESAAADELDDADGPSFTAGGAFVPTADATTYNLPMGANMTLVTGERQTAPDEADPYAEREASAAYNINVLRGFLHGTDLPDDVRTAGLDALGKLEAWIAAQMPQRATDIDEDLLWQHTCGRVTYSETDGPPPECMGPACFLPGKWQALYTLGDAR